MIVGDNQEEEDSLSSARKKKQRDLFCAYFYCEKTVIKNQGKNEREKEANKFSNRVQGRSTRFTGRVAHEMTLLCESPERRE